MDLKEIRRELRKLSALAEGWSSLQAAPPVERDMALEKLRALYETFRFCPVPRPVVGRALPGHAASDAPHSAVVSGARSVSFDEETSEFEMVDLSEVLSLGEVDETGETFEENDVAGDVPSAGKVRYEDSGEDEGPEIIEFEPEPARPVRSVPKPAPAPQPAPASAPQPAAVPVNVAASAAEKSPEKPAEELAERPVDAPAPELAAPIHAAESGSMRSESAPALFEEDEESAQHRRKQRVIRALYDETPASAPRASAGAAPAFSDPDDPELSEEEPSKLRPLRSRTRQESAAPEIMLLDALTEEPVGESRKAFGGPEPDGADDPDIAGERSEPFGPVDLSRMPADGDGSAPHVLGEVIKPGVQTLADTIAPAPRRYGAPIADLRQAIGINDKFLMIRDLFGGDGALFDATVEALNAQQSLDDCMIYIAENFAWNPESESAALIMELLERKFA